MERVLPGVIELTAAHPAQTVFTHFIPLEKPEEGRGAWKRYYQRWANMTLSVLDRNLVDLVPPLAKFAPPAKIVDKRVYSPWNATNLSEVLQSGRIDTLIVTGGETDVCVLSTVLGAIDFGYRVILVKDGLCSSADETHDALMTVYSSRYSQQVELVELQEVLLNWRP